MSITTDQNQHEASSVILGIESSCDETAASIVTYHKSRLATINSSIIKSQQSLHKNFGGVVPEIAARAHSEYIDECVKLALEKSNKDLNSISTIAVTAGPGLIGGIFSGVMFAQGLSLGSGKPLIGINHLAGHALTPRLTDRVPYPYLMLLASGGHCQFILVKGPNCFSRLGGTIDDAPGEAFDKVARLLGLPQPGGPSIEKSALKGDATRFSFPRPLINRSGCDMSFSGLKTAVARAIDTLSKKQGGLYESDRSDICASFQQAICDIFEHKATFSIRTYLKNKLYSKFFSVSGGVAANLKIRATLEGVAKKFDVKFSAPPLSLCTDNAAMIAYAAGELQDQVDWCPKDLVPRPRWPLDNNKIPLLGSGKKGPKA